METVFLYAASIYVSIHEGTSSQHSCEFDKYLTTGSFFIFIRRVLMLHVEKCRPVLILGTKVEGVDAQGLTSTNYVH